MPETDDHLESGTAGCYGAGAAFENEINKINRIANIDMTIMIGIRLAEKFGCRPLLEDIIYDEYHVTDVLVPIVIGIAA